MWIVLGQFVILVCRFLSDPLTAQVVLGIELGELIAQQVFQVRLIGGAKIFGALLFSGLSYVGRMLARGTLLSNDLFYILDEV